MTVTSSQDVTVISVVHQLLLNYPQLHTVATAHSSTLSTASSCWLPDAA